MDNPFGRPVIDNYCEDLDVFIDEMKKVNSLSWPFNPWYHRLPNWLLSLITPRSPRIIYSEDYIGVERRTRLTKLIDNRIRAMKIVMMTKTQKIPLNEEQEVCDLLTWHSSGLLSDVEFKSKSNDLSLTAFLSSTGLNITSIFSKSRQQI